MMRANSVSQSLIQADDTPWKDWKWKEMRNSRCSNEPSNRSQKAEKTPRSGMHKKEKENQNQENMIAIPWKSAWLSSLPSHIQSAASFHFISFLSFFLCSLLSSLHQLQHHDTYYILAYFLVIHLPQTDIFIVQSLSQWLSDWAHEKMGDLEEQRKWTNVYQGCHCVVMNEWMSEWVSEGSKEARKESKVNDES